MTDSRSPRKPPVVPYESPTAESTDPVDHAQVAEQVRRLDTFVRGRLAALEQAQRDHDAREQKLNALQETVQHAADAFADQLAKAQSLTQQLEVSGQSAAKYLADSAGPLNDRLDQVKQLDRSVDQRMARMQQMHKQAGEAVDKFLLRSLRETKEEAGELIAPIKQELDAHLARQTAALEAKVNEKIAELDVDVEDALAPLTSRFEAALEQARGQADALAGALPGRVEHELAKLEADTAKRIRQIALIAQSAGEKIAVSLAKVHDTARQQADRAQLANAAGRTPAPPVVETTAMDTPLQAIAQRLKQTQPNAKQNAM